jgi:hypothetical protein
VTCILLQEFASLGPSCTTSAEGICTLDISTDGYDGATRSAVVTAPGEGPLVVPSLPSGYSSNAGAYAASVVLDRQLVKPGDDLHITGGRGWAECQLSYHTCMVAVQHSLRHMCKGGLVPRRRVCGCKIRSC